VLLVSVVVMGGAIALGDRRGKSEMVFIYAIAALALGNAMLLYGSSNAIALIAALIVFFSAFNILEANLPSLVSKAAPARAKGTALGVYSSLQFLGIFAGGALGGFVNQAGGATGVFAFTMTLALIWLVVAAAVRRRIA
jgi:predicted MFS family arabinose efflux permease